MSKQNKKCTNCNREFPLNSDYFFKSKNRKDGFNNRCKECCGRLFTNKLSHIPKEGYVFCKKCDRELPHTYQYFPEDKSCKTGLRYVCRECSKDYGRFLDDGETPKRKSEVCWTDDEIKLLIDNYHDYYGKELKEKFFPNRTVRAIESQASILGIAYKSESHKDRRYKEHAEFVGKIMKGKILSEETKLKLSISKKEYYATHDSWWKGKKRSEEQCKLISKNASERGLWKGDNNPRHINPLCGENNGRWKGGILSFYTELRSDTKEWFSESIKFCNYNCVITGLNFDNVHHTTAFKDIVNETFIISGLDQRDKVSDYSNEEFDYLRGCLKELHNTYGYGAPLDKDIHKLFHDTYGYTKITPYDFLDFCYRIDIGEFNDWFNSNNKQININYNYIEYLENKLEELA